MINLLDHDNPNPNTEKQKNRLDQILANMRADCIDYKTYQEIYSMIPDVFICQKDEYRDTKEILGFPTKMTKRKLNMETQKDIIKKLRIFAVTKNLTGNQLAFNEHFDDYFVRTIYKSN